MANEMSISLQLRVANGYFADAISKSFTDDFPILGKGGGVQIIGTSEEALAFGDVLYEGWLYIENLDPTNSIDWGPDSSGMVPVGRIDPGEGVLFRAKPGVTIMAKARTAECRVVVTCFDTATST